MIAGADDIVIVKKRFFVFCAHENAVERVHVLNLGTGFGGIESSVDGGNRRIGSDDIGVVAPNCDSGERIVELASMIAGEHAQRAAANTQ